MKKVNWLRLWVVCVLSAAMISLLDIDTLGSFMHERIGLALGLLALVHLWVDRRQIAVLLKRIWRPDTPYPLRLGYIVDVLLFLGLITILITGVGTSATIFTQFQLPHRRFYMDLHTYISYLTMGLMLLHLWLHKSWLKGMVKTVRRQWASAEGRRAVVLWLAALAAAIGLSAASVLLFDHNVISPGGNGWQGGRQAAVSLEERTIGEETFTPESLAQYDGKNGQSAYIAYEGLVYDVGAYFIQGEHHQGVHAGMDLTGQITRRKCLNALNHCPIVGSLAVEGKQNLN